jgi:hypothetical protein
MESRSITVDPASETASIELTGLNVSMQRLADIGSLVFLRNWLHQHLQTLAQPVQAPKDPEDTLPRLFF